jgi:hypothetical protein
MPAALAFIVIPAKAGIQRWPTQQIQQDYVNCRTRLTMSQPAPSVSAGILSAKDRFFLYISRMTISATYGDFLRSVKLILVPV